MVRQKLEKLNNIYVTEDKFNKFILDTVADEIIKNAKKYSIYLRKDKIHKWYRLALDVFYVKAIDVKNTIFNCNDVKFVTNQEFISLLQNTKYKKPNLANLEIIGHANRFYRGDPELLFYLKKLETLGIYINKNDIRLKDFKVIFYPKKNLLSLEGNGRYEECNIWQYFTTEDFLKILENHILEMRKINKFYNIKIKQYKY